MPQTYRKLSEINMAVAEKAAESAGPIADSLILFSKMEDLPFTLEAKRMDCIFIGLVLEGSISMTLDTRYVTMNAGDCIALGAGHVVSDFEVSRDCRGLAYIGSREFFQESVKNISEISTLFLCLRDNPIQKLSSKEIEVYRTYFKAIQTRFATSPQRFLRPLTSTLFRALIYDLGPLVWKENERTIPKVKTRAENIFAVFIHLVEENFREQRKVSWYAEQLSISPKYLSEMVKAVSRQTPNDWIDKYVVMELRLLLRDTTMSIKQVTEKMNFPNQSFLGKYFKEHVGLSPSEYRKNS